MRSTLLNNSVAARGMQPCRSARELRLNNEIVDSLVREQCCSLSEVKRTGLSLHVRLHDGRVEVEMKGRRRLAGQLKYE